MTKALALSYAANGVPPMVAIESAHMEASDSGDVLCLSALCGGEITFAQLWLTHRIHAVQQAGYSALLMLFDAMRIPPTGDLEELIFRPFAKPYWDQIVAVYEGQIAAMATPPIALSNQDAGRYVYVISCPDNDRALCKIGIASSPEKRLRQLSTSSPHRLRIEMARYSDHARSIEGELHAHFAAERQNGEWFTIEPDVAISRANALIASRERKS